jgi:hypothetical protein
VKQVDKKIVGSILITLIALFLTVSLKYYTSTQMNQNNIPSPTPTPASTPMPTPTPTAEPTLADYVVYEWHLKAEYINNVTWLNWSMAGDYDSGKTWSENYISHINSYWAIPQQIANSDMGVLAKIAFVRQVSVNASFNEATGFTKATYQYGEDNGVPWSYAIEANLPILADSRGWTKTIV